MCKFISVTPYRINSTLIPDEYLIFACTIDIQNADVRYFTDPRRVMMNKYQAIFLLFVALLSAKDIFITGNSASDDNDFKEFGDDPEIAEHDEEIEVREQSHFSAPQKFSTNADLPPVRFAFCVSCGYRQAFDDFSRIIREKYPSIQIDGANYPPTQMRALVAQFVGVAKIIIIVMIISGRNPFPGLGMETPAIVNWMLSNKFSACLMIFMLSNTVESSMMSTGAFEIYVGEAQIWSKMESGRVPSPPELLQAIESQLEIQGAKMSDAFSFE
uniref:SelT-like protein n=1 Tax=Steinernema glaseri TaxID=37863 RepID=A0A1I7ZNC2_9BILA